MQVVVRTGGARQAGGPVSHSRERGAAEDMHGHRARQVAGLPPAAVLEVERVERLQVVRVGLQAHLAQEFILQDAVIPDLRGDSGVCVSKTRNIASGRWVGRAGPRSLFPQYQPSQGKARVLGTPSSRASGSCQSSLPRRKPSLSLLALVNLNWGVNLDLT